MHNKILLRLQSGLTAVVISVALPAAPLAYGAVFDFDPALTKVSFTLGAVLHTVHGTFKVKSGRIEFDPATGEASGQLVVDAASGASGNGDRDRRMHYEILESARFPEVTFNVLRVTGSVSRQGPSQVEIQGVMKLHGSEHEVASKAQVEAEGDRWNAQVHFVVPYVAWGLKNPSTFLLRVSKEVNIDVQATGRLSGSAAE